MYPGKFLNEVTVSCRTYHLTDREKIFIFEPSFIYNRCRMRVREGNKEEDILKAAIDVFARYGFHEAKISRIAAAAGVSTGSVYVYYKNKEDLLLEIFKQLWGKLYQELKLIVERKDINAVEKFDSLIDLIFDNFIENPSLAAVFVNEQIHIQRNSRKNLPFAEKFLELGEMVVIEGIKSGLFNPNIDVKILRLYIFGGLRFLLHQWAHHPKDYPLNVLRNNVKFISKHGLLN